MPKRIRKPFSVMFKRSDSEKRMWNMGKELDAYKGELESLREEIKSLKEGSKSTRKKSST